MLDGAVAVFCAVGGVEPQSETVWRQANKYRVPRMAFVNKMDRAGADFLRVVGQIASVSAQPGADPAADRGGREVSPASIDLIQDEGDSLERRTQGTSTNCATFPTTWSVWPREWREKLVEAAAEADETLLEKYLEEGDLSEDRRSSAACGRAR